MVAPQAGAPPAIARPFPGNVPGAGPAVYSSAGHCKLSRVRRRARWSAPRPLAPAGESCRRAKTWPSCNSATPSARSKALYVPVADMKLAPEDSVYFSHHVLLWIDPQVRMSAMSMRGAWKRMFAGMPLIMTQAQGPGHIAFSKDEPGELIALPLQPGQTVDVREHMFLAATANIEYDWFQTNIGIAAQSGEGYRKRISPRHVHGPVFRSRGSGAAVAACRRQRVRARAGCWRDDSGQADSAWSSKIRPSKCNCISSSPTRALLAGAHGPIVHIWLRLIGPGRVAIQSVFERVEQEGGNIIDTSYSTFQAW